MFETSKVSAFLQAAKLAGKDDDKSVRCTFYITPISYDLACEVSPLIGERLFRKDKSGKQQPAPEITTIGFNLAQIPAQTLEWHPSDDKALDQTGVMLQNVAISGIHALKLFPDEPGFTLAFTADIPMDDMSVKMAQKYFRRSVHLTFETMQGALFPKATVTDTVKNPKCERCDDPAMWRDEEGAFFCKKDQRRGKGTTVLIVTLETPAQAAARIKKEKAEKETDAKGPALPGLTVGNGADDKADNSHANRPRGGKTTRGKEAGKTSVH